MIELFISFGQFTVRAVIDFVETAVLISCKNFYHNNDHIDIDFVSFLIERIFGGQLFMSCCQFMFRAVIDVQVETDADGVDLTT